jgi:hypothetical protein
VRLNAPLEPRAAGRLRREAGNITAMQTYTAGDKRIVRTFLVKRFYDDSTVVGVKC